MYIFNNKFTFRNNVAQKHSKQSQVLFSATNSHNIFATKCVATTRSSTPNKNNIVPTVSSSAYSKRIAMIESKLLHSNCYQRAFPLNNELNVFFCFNNK